jgi:hypothetical protein
MAELSEQPKIENPEILEIKERLEKIEAKLEKAKEVGEKEKLIKQEIKSYLQTLQQTPSFASAVQTRDEVEEIKKLSEPDQQIGALISLVFDKGLLEAISVARALDNPALLDEFHDTLVDRYYEILSEKKLLEF